MHVLRLVSIISCLLLAYEGVASNLSPESAQKILDNLYNSFADYRFDKPTLLFSNEDSMAARYYPRRNLILIENKAIEVCNSFGERSESALAFIVAHELVHAKESTITTSYLAYDLAPSAETKRELQADIQGLFNSYICGYKSIEILPDLIQRLYEAYDFIGKELKGYPLIHDRKYTAQIVSKNVEDLITIFEAAAYLSTIGKYELSAILYDHIRTYYPSRDILNNMATNLILEALNFTGEYVDPFLFPIELDWNTCLRNPPALEGSKGLNPDQQRQRKHLLRKAQAILNQVIRMDSRYAVAHRNKMSVMLLQDSILQAIDYYYQTPVLNRSSDDARQLLYANALAMQPGGDQMNRAQEIWHQLLSSSDPALAFMAQSNLASSKDQPCEIAEVSTCILPFDPSEKIDNVDCILEESNNRIPLRSKRNYYYAIKTKDQSVVFIIYDGSEKAFTLQIIVPKVNLQLPHRASYERYSLVNTNIGSILDCEKQLALCNLNQLGMITKWAKYYIP